MKLSLADRIVELTHPGHVPTPSEKAFLVRALAIVERAAGEAAATRQGNQ